MTLESVRLASRRQAAARRIAQPGAERARAALTAAGYSLPRPWTGKPGRSFSADEVLAGLPRDPTTGQTHDRQRSGYAAQRQWATARLAQIASGRVSASPAAVDRLTAYIAGRETLAARVGKPRITAAPGLRAT